MQRSTRLALTALATGLAGCAPSDQVTAPATAPLTPQGPALSAAPYDPAIQRHVMPTLPMAAKSALYTGSVSGGPIAYRGGRIIPGNTNVVVVYWGSGAMYPGGPASSTGLGSSDGSLIGKFLNGLNSDPNHYFRINTTYTNSSGTKAAGTVAYVKYWVTGSTPPTSPTDQNILDLLSSGFKGGSIAYDPNTIYAVMTGPNVNLGGGFGSQYCAYHGNGTVSTTSGNQKVIYAAMPYNQGTIGCMAQTTGPNGDPADPEVSVLAHEIEEATTDPDLNAWYDNRGYENADKCAWTWGTTKTAANGAAYNMTLNGLNFLVQRNWIAKNGGCSMTG